MTQSRQNTPINDEVMLRYQEEQNALALEERVYACTHPDKILHRPDQVRKVGALDSHAISDHDIRASLIVVTLDDHSKNKQRLIYSSTEIIANVPPYRCGYLGFREAAAFAALLDACPEHLRPDVVMVDGNGYWHSRRFGSASHVGWIARIPTVGVSKALYVLPDMTCQRQQQYDVIAGGEVGIYEQKGDVLGVALRCPGTISKHPIYVSRGHRVTLDLCVYLVVRTTISGNRLPEPIRLADKTCRNNEKK